jgi:hypothetical protein
MSDVEWDESVVWVVDEIVQERGVDGAESELQTRLEDADAELSQRIHEGLAWLRREVER